MKHKLTITILTILAIVTIGMTSCTTSTNLASIKTNYKPITNTSIEPQLPDSSYYNEPRVHNSRASTIR